MKHAEKQPDELISLLSRNEDSTGEVSAELLRHFFQGYPVEKLRPLIHSSDVVTRGRALWIASELGRNARPLLADVVWALRGVDRRGRFFAMDVVLSSADRSDGAVVAMVIELLCDQDRAVRWKAIQFMCRASRPQLLGALDAVPSDSIHLEPVRLIAEVPSESEEPRPKAEGVARLIDWSESALKDKSPLRRRYGVAAAMRLVTVDPTLLRLAADSADDEISSAAREYMELIK